MCLRVCVCVCKGVYEVDAHEAQVKLAWLSTGNGKGASFRLAQPKNARMRALARVNSGEAARGWAEQLISVYRGARAELLLGFRSVCACTGSWLGRVCDMAMTLAVVKQSMAARDPAKERGNRVLGRLRRGHRRPKHAGCKEGQEGLTVVVTHRWAKGRSGNVVVG